MKNYLIRIITIIILLFTTNAVHAEHEIIQGLFEHAKTSPRYLENDVDKLLTYLLKPAKTKKDSATVIAYWVITHINYDVELFLQTGNRPIKSWKEIIASKKAICAGYAELYQTLCNKAKINCFVINGYAKGYGYKAQNRFKDIDHAWNVLILDNEFYLMDLTWASGYVYTKNGKLTFKRATNSAYLFTNPSKFIEDHLPAQPKWQLLSNPVSMADYIQYQTYAEMTKAKSAPYHYQKWIFSYLRLNKFARMIRDAEEAHRFYPNGKALANTYENVAYGLCTGKYHEQNFKRALFFYEKAETIYMKSVWRDREREASCAKSIKYVTYRLKNKR